jgi:hypothetical protein
MSNTEHGTRNVEVKGAALPQTVNTEPFKGKFKAAERMFRAAARVWRKHSAVVALAAHHKFDRIRPQLCKAVLRSGDNPLTGACAKIIARRFTRDERLALGAVSVADFILRVMSDAGYTVDWQCALDEAQQICPGI